MDLINREDAAELVTKYCQEYYNLNPVAVIEKLMEMPTQPEEYTIEMQEADIDEAMKRLRDARVTILPSAEPEIIRCKDCNHYQFADNRAFGMPVKMCKWFGFEDVDDYDFCSRAERRTDE